MTHVDASSQELLYTTTMSLVLTRAGDEAPRESEPPHDPAYLLLALMTLPDSSVYRPLRELGFEYESLRRSLTLREETRGRCLVCDRNDYDAVLAEAAHAASLRSGAKMIGLGDLAIGIFAVGGRTVMQLMNEREVSQVMALRAIGAPDEYILRFLELPAE